MTSSPAFGAQVIFAPRRIRGIGVFDVATRSFELVDISATLANATDLPPADSDLFAGAAALSDGRVVSTR